MVAFIPRLLWRVISWEPYIMGYLPIVCRGSFFSLYELFWPCGTIWTFKRSSKFVISFIPHFHVEWEPCEISLFSSHCACTLFEIYISLSWSHYCLYTVIVDLLLLQLVIFSDLDFHWKIGVPIIVVHLA